MSCCDLGKKIKAERLYNKMTQAELCGDFLTRNMLSKIENGVAQPSLNTLLYLSSRLEVSLEYLLDDEDSRDDMQDRRLFNLIKEEFYKENYELCLQYLQGIKNFTQETEIIFGYSLYYSALENLNDGRLKKSKESFDKVVALKNIDFNIRNESKMYSTFIKEFICCHEKNGEEAALLAIRNFSGCSSDLLPLARIIATDNKFGIEAAEQQLSVTAFSKPQYKVFAEAQLAFEKNIDAVAISKSIECLGGGIMPILACRCYTILEKMFAQQKNFEKAYEYSQQRKNMMMKLISE